ncbi:hypothetical protein [Saccharopolyspora elongata]|uniref:SH3b domain-containing protein n=1 Tax=Saccharopolyspora elongata TaxID=2530387 RepID=A0A4R4YA15_9PSEU|nr:hypothetical protein [Saccharopolyspora elongata]TDD41371.1 hypothetical protein E1288_32865 [Saccharopolyspora elongata]
MRKAHSAAVNLAAAAGILMLGLTATAHAEGACPPGTALSIQDGARIHRAADLKSPVDGVYYKAHAYRVHQFVGGAPTTPEWVNLTDDTNGVTGWVHGSVAACLGLTPPSA